MRRAGWVSRLNQAEDRRAPGRPTGIPASSPLAPLLEHAGGVVALAESCGVSRVTLSRIGAGTQAPGKLVKATLNAWARRRGLAEPYPEKENGT